MQNKDYSAEKMAVMNEEEYQLTGKYDLLSTTRVKKVLNEIGQPIPSAEDIYKKPKPVYDLKIVIHRGSNEIGGSCVEVICGKARLVIDLGMPLGDGNGKSFDFSQYESLNAAELVDRKILPDIEGIYDGTAKNIRGVLISHPHFDHYGLLNYISKNIPVYLSQSADEIIGLNNIFTRGKINISKPVYFPVNERFGLGPFKITAFLNDHSSFISYSFLIEAGGKSIFYSGDFRSHGRKGKSFYWFLHNCPKNVDALLMEGTTIGRNPARFISETVIEKKLLGIFSKPDKINLVYTSGQNIDRLVSIYRACKRLNKPMVIDFYTAAVLQTLSAYAKIPYPSAKYPGIKVYYPYYLSKRIAEEGKKEILYQFKEFKITKPQIDKNFKNIVMLVRPSVKKDLEKLSSLEGGNFIYSQWGGYRDQDQRTAKFIEYIKSISMKDISLHTSGHADIETLKKYVEAIDPKVLIPIHTDKPDEYVKHFNVPVKLLPDGQEHKV